MAPPSSSFASRFALRALGLLGLLSVGVAQALPFNFQLSVLAEHDSNVSRSVRSEDRLSDAAVHAVLVASQSRVLGRDQIFAWGFKVSSQQWSRYAGLGALEAGLRAGLKHKFGLGPQAPVLHLEVSAAERWARVRDNGGLAATSLLSLSHRPSETFRYSLALDFDSLEARGSFFQREGFGLSGNAYFILTERLSLELGLRQRIGGVLGFGPWASLGVLGYGGQGTSLPVSLFRNDYYVFAYTGRTLGSHLVFNYSLGPRQALTGGLDCSVTSRGSQDYTVFLFTLGYAYQF